MSIQGLKYVADFITQSEEAELLGALDGEPWLADLKRRVQHYGYRYDHGSQGRSINASRPIARVGSIHCGASRRRRPHAASPRAADRE